MQGSLAVWVGSSRQGEALERLARDAGDELEILVDVEDGEIGQFRRGRDQKVRYRRGAVVTTVSQRGLHRDSSILHRRGEVLDGHR